MDSNKLMKMATELKQIEDLIEKFNTEYTNILKQKLKYEFVEISAIQEVNENIENVSVIEEEIISNLTIENVRNMENSLIENEVGDDNESLILEAIDRVNLIENIEIVKEINNQSLHVCNICNYSCKSNWDFKKHCKTKKHLRNIEKNQ